jgi:hypothetical protein
MKTMMLRKDTKEKTLVICCLMSSLFINCASTPTENMKNNYQNLNSEFSGEFYIDKRQRFSIVIPKGWEIIDWEVRHEGNVLDSLVLVGLMIEYNVNSNGSLFYINTSIPISKFVDEAFIKAKQVDLLIEEPQRGNITISPTGLQGEYIKILRYQENNGRVLWQKVYYIPHQIGDSIMMITCTAIPDDNVDLDIVFDKFVKTFNWIR